MPYYLSPAPPLYKVKFNNFEELSPPTLLYQQRIFLTNPHNRLGLYDSEGVLWAPPLQCPVLITCYFLLQQRGQSFRLPMPVRRLRRHPTDHTTPRSCRA